MVQQNVPFCSLDPQKRLFKNSGERRHSLLGNISLRNLVVPKTTASAEALTDGVTQPAVLSLQSAGSTT